MADCNKILVTGAAGHLGSHLIPLLVDEGFEVKGLDIVEPKAPLPDGCAFVQADLTDPDALKAALAGSDIIVHCASIHPWKSYTDSQYLDNNIKGTWLLYSVAAELGIDKIVLTSSIAANGYQNVPLEAWPVQEDNYFALGEIYSYTKNVQEVCAKLYAQRDDIRTIALRPPAFMPSNPLGTGMAFLNGTFSKVCDVAGPHVAAVLVMSGRRRPGEPLGPFEAFHITHQMPYTKEDVAQMGPDASLKDLVKKYFPEAFDWLVERGFEGRGLPIVYDNSKAKRVLGWEALYTFKEWFAEHKDKL